MKTSLINLHRLLGIFTALLLAVMSATAADGPGKTLARAGDSAKGDQLFPGARRILFLGDSITYAGQYVDDFETALRLHDPGREIEIINCGLPSETVSGLSEEGHAGGKFPRPDLHERLDRVLAKVKPDLVFACYGMNDGIYLPLADDRLEAFKKGMTKLHEKVEAAGAKIVYLTPAVFDPVPIRPKVAPAEKVDANHPFEGYDNVLEAYARWLMSQKSAGWQVIDVHESMAAAIKEGRKRDPSFTFSRDGVHPDAAGHRVMADAVLSGIGAKFGVNDPAFGDVTDATSVAGKVHKMVRERGRVMTDAWLTATGHKRPGMKQGLDMTAATEKVSKTQQQIRELLTKP